MPILACAISNGCTYLEDQKFVILFNNIFSHDAKVMSESRVEAMYGDGQETIVELIIVSEERFQNSSEQLAVVCPRRA